MKIFIFSLVIIVSIIGVYSSIKYYELKPINETLNL